MSTIQICATCRFYDSGTTKAFPEVSGMCRRYAPTGPAVGDGRWQIFPPMNASQWCGDYRPRTDAGSSAASAAA